ncbi:hypothetical protein RM780_22345 [Streptomyces sp. DSM 44917]|uniref:Resolvase/invertase-type recombinase catalytic domain-containing protein n=1 Tax=Streptomyces boetiae TaxID=3075541 RepID=A0ABU2LDM3_9ACTN|nr:hypothetical protein [Streptomyces sp. DSM 44917]MDT0309676.1 hypothetical protein [Streptomyces sp. DSM 44917]
MTDPARPLLGYLRALPDLPDHALDHLCDELRRFAERENFVLLDVYVERQWLQDAAWDVLVERCARDQVRHVVVPTYEHLHVMPALSVVMQRAVEAAIDGYVWFVHPDATVPPRPLPGLRGVGT